MTSFEELGYQSTRTHALKVISAPKTKLLKGQRPAWLPEGVYLEFEEGVLLTLANTPEYWSEIKDNAFLLDLLRRYLSARTEAFRAYQEQKDKNENNV